MIEYEIIRVMRSLMLYKSGMCGKRGAGRVVESVKKLVKDVEF